MPYALLSALVASLLIHLLALFGAELRLDAESPAAPPPILAMLKMPPKPVKPVNSLPAPSIAASTPVAPAPPALQQPLPRQKPRRAPTKPVIRVPASVESPISLPTPEAEPEIVPVLAAEPVEAAEAADTADAIIDTPDISAISARLPANGAIDYRVERGDSGFAIGVARHQWEIEGEHYRLTSIVQSTGLVRLFKDFRVEMESRGTFTENGLQPDFFVMRRNDKPTREKAFFDWQRMKVRISDKAEQDLDPGAQDFLSFNYQLGFLPAAGAGTDLPIATGRKYSDYHLESLGDEEIETPAGRLRTLHLRAPGENTTELWLAYDYRLLPVKIRHVDSKGDSLVQVATHLEMSTP